VFLSLARCRFKSLPEHPFPRVTPALLDKLPRSWPPVQPSPRWHRDPALVIPLAACREATRAHATSFFFASRLLPESKKCAAYAIYAFCRWVDDSFDEMEAGRTAPEASALFTSLDEMLSGRSSLSFAPAFAAGCREYGIELSWCHDLIEGCARDRLPLRLASLADLEVYCYYVASVVGIMMSRIFGLQDATLLPHAVEMGLAMQLTNILRDVREDYVRGRVYLPAEDLSRFEISETQLREGRLDGNWRALMHFEIDRARAWYAAAELGLPGLDNDGSRMTARVMSRVYAGILTEIERRQGDVFSARCHVPLWRKCLILGQCMVGQ
jgi:phytoene synthase